MNYANGWRGRGFYYGPPDMAFYSEGPDVEFFAERGEVPSDYWNDNVTPSAESPAAAVQDALAQRGYYSGAIDGQIGPESSRAIARYQADNGLAVTGNITQSLLQSLGID